MSLVDTQAFSPFFIDYIQQKETLRQFYNRFPEVNNFEDQIAEKTIAFPQSHRDALVLSLERQYQGITISDAVQKNISFLKDPKTFTITTGHQLNIFTGPLYFIFKIVTIINACKQLKAQYPEFNFVPVYWMASEDHDYEEIKYFRLHGKKHIWSTDQTGAVGRFTTKGLDTLAKEAGAKVFTEAYTKQKNLSAAVRYYVNALFENEGLVVLDGDDRSLKSEFKNVIREDILRSVNKSFVDHTDTSLQALGYKTQIFCREINFFYLTDGLRSRIEKEGDHFKVLDTELSFSATEIETLIENEPEKFSPNVILRPLYQEMILPNLAYVGGPAEVIYWLQLKNVFAHFHTPFPILMPRNFGMVVDHEVARKLSKTGVELKELFKEKHVIFKDWALQNSKNKLNTTDEQTETSKIFEQLRIRAEAIDKTLGPNVGAEGKRTLKSLEKIEQKMLRAEKRLHADKLRQIESVKDALFPNGSLQERTDNFLNFYQRDPEFIDRLIDNFDAFDFQFNILEYSS